MKTDCLHGSLALLVTLSTSCSVCLGEPPIPSKSMDVVAAVLLVSSSSGDRSGDVAYATHHKAERMQAISQLGEVLLGEHFDSPDVGTAAAALLEVDPQTVQDKRIRSTVARGFKRLAYDSQRHREQGIRGMGHWGGNYCIPYLAELMELESFHGSVAIYEVLSETNDPRGAEAIAMRLGNFFDHKRAVAALQQMGPLAEEALIETVSSNNPYASYTAIQLLGEQGTRTCLPALRDAAKHGIPEIQRIAAATIDQVQRRAAVEAVGSRQ